MADTGSGGRRRPAVPREPPDGEAALDVAARYLATRPRTRWEVERRLRRAGASDEVTRVTVERLVGLGLVDDVAFAHWWAEQRDRHAPRGRRMVEDELRQHGVPRDVIESLRNGELSEPVLDAEGLPATEEERAAAALERHLRGRELPEDPRARQRIGMYLIRRGFAPDVARTAIRRAAGD